MGYCCVTSDRMTMAGFLGMIFCVTTLNIIYENIKLKENLNIH